MPQGYIHSIYTGGMVDGPGIRCVVFFAGCPLRCVYCHNPDSWNIKVGKFSTVDDTVAEILKYREFYEASGGGVTFSGGEPFMQPEFLTALLKACKERDIHTAVDTSGYAKDLAHTVIAKSEATATLCSLQAPQSSNFPVKEALEYTDLLMLDIKSYNPETYKKITGVSLDKTLAMLDLSRDMGVDVWVRYVLVPGLNDDMTDIKRLGKFLKRYPNVKKVEVLPFHKKGESKWDALGVAYSLKDTQPPTEEQVEAVRKLFL